MTWTVILPIISLSVYISACQIKLQFVNKRNIILYL